MDDTVTIGTLTIQKSTDTYRYGHHAVPIQIMAMQNNNDYSGTKTIDFTLDFHTIKQNN